MPQRARYPPGAGPVTRDDMELAVVLRQLQWALDSAARDCRMLTTDRAEELASLLEDTASLLRVSRGHGVIEGGALSD